MRPGPGPLTTRFEQTLIYLDGPQLVTLQSVAGTKLVGVAINLDGFRQPYFVAQVSDDQFADYLNERFDLRYLLEHPIRKRWFIVDLADVLGPDFKLHKYTLIPSERERMLPESGLFSRDHTHDYVAKAGASLSSQFYAVDGSWDLQEFSVFYGGVADLYGMYTALERVRAITPANDDSEILSAFTRPYESGGDYGGLYSSLQKHQPRSARPVVRRIKYASPGFLQIKGREDVLSDLRSLIDNFDKKYDTITEAHDSFKRFLREMRLLGSSSSDFDATFPAHADVEERGRQFAPLIGAADYDLILKASSGKVLTAAKILLSIYRRLVRMREFISQGRVVVLDPSSPRITDLIGAIDP